MQESRLSPASLNVSCVGVIVGRLRAGLVTEVKTAQVITYFYESGIDGGFTYWPDGPDRPPQRYVPPFHNLAIVSDNSQMYHRREANGPKELRNYPGLTLNTELRWDGSGRWVLSNDGTEVGRFDEANRRILFHWTGLVFQNRAEMTAYLEHTDDITHDRVFETLIADMHSRGISFSEPSDPLNDANFTALLNQTYAMLCSSILQRRP